MAQQSRNSWIRRDDPRLVSTQHKDMYEDILEERRHAYDFCFATRNRDIPAYKWNEPRIPEQVKSAVLKSDRVKFAVDQVCQVSKASPAKVWIDAQAILNEMAHNLSMRSIRLFAYGLMKMFKRLYRRIYVNEDGINRLRQLLYEYPVLVLPSHRSYMDFLLISYVFYHYNLPMPVVAAAMDFMGMNFFGSLMRNSGAFYIRRTFGGDQLYWAVFTEYVQAHICNGDAPIEFFVEGTRSRTGKSYSPRIGMLSASLEPYFKAHIPDTMLVPVSISYGRILEEKLYAYELLGVPKPRESTSGLIKARSVLEEDFGDIHIHVSEPISIRHYSLGKIDRVVHGMAPRYIASLTDDEQGLMNTLAHHIVITHLKNMVITPWSLMAAVLIQNREGLSVKALVKEVEWLKRQASNLGAYVDWPGNENPETVIREDLELHQNLVRVSQPDLIEIALPAVSKSSSSRSPQDKLMMTAAQHMMIVIYRNQVLHVFVRIAMIAVAVNACRQETLSLDDLYKQYAFLEQLLCRDFIFQPGNTKQDFDQSLMMLTHTCGVVVEDGNVLVEKSTNKAVNFFSQMFEPFLLTYWVLCQYLLSMHNDAQGKPLAKPPKMICMETQMLSSQLLRDNQARHLEILCLDTLNNGLNALVIMGAVIKEKKDGHPYMSPETIVLSKISQDLGSLIDAPAIRTARINVETKTITINSKL